MASHSVQDSNGNHKESERHSGTSSTRGHRCKPQLRLQYQPADESGAHHQYQRNDQNWSAEHTRNPTRSQLRQ